MSSSSEIRKNLEFSTDNVTRRRTQPWSQEDCMHSHSKKSRLGLHSHFMLPAIPRESLKSSSQKEILPPCIFDAAPAQSDSQKQVGGISVCDLSGLKSTIQVSKMISDFDMSKEDSQKSLSGLIPNISPDVGLLDTIKNVIQEVNSYSLVIEQNQDIFDAPEFSIIIQKLLHKMEEKENIFQKSLDKFKLNKPFLLSEGFEILNNDAQSFLRTKYNTYIETLEFRLTSMKAKRKTLMEAFKKYHRNDIQRNEKCVVEHVIEENDSSNSGSAITSPMEQSSSDFSSSSVTPRNDMELTDMERQVIKSNTIDETINEIIKVHCSADATKENWPGKSLPSLDDLVSEESSESKDSLAAPTSDSLLPSNDTQEDGSDDIVEALTAEIPELYTDESCGDLGNHFLLASVTSPVNPGYRYQVPLQPSQKLNKNPLEMSNTHCCQDCGQSFGSLELLLSHKKITHVPLLCTVCAELLSNVGVLSEHIKRLHPSYTLCQECLKAVEKANLSNHKETSHAPLIIESSKTNEELKCRACHIVFSTFEEKDHHEKERHKNLFYPCKICGKLFINQYGLQKHSSQHLCDKSNICKVCHSSFSDNKSLVRHLKLSHLMNKNKLPKKYGCLICQQVHSTDADLISHMRTFHQNDNLVEKASQGDSVGLQKHKCQHCSLYFKNIKVRAIHEIMFHESPPFVCCVCKEAFFTKSKFDVHLLKHTRLEGAANKKGLVVNKKVKYTPLSTSL